MAALKSSEKSRRGDFVMELELVQQQNIFTLQGSCRRFVVRGKSHREGKVSLMELRRSERVRDFCANFRLTVSVIAESRMRARKRIVDGGDH